MAITPRQQSLMKLCATPQTISDLSEELQVGYHTIRNEVLELLETKLLQEMPWRKGQSKLYQTAYTIADNSQIDKMQFSFDSDPYSAITLLKTDNLHELASVAGKIIQLALVKPLWEYHVRTDPERLATDGHPSKELVLEKLRSAVHVLDQLAKLGEQFINAPIWNDDNVPSLLIGSDPVDWSELQTLLKLLEDFAIERQW